MTPFSFPFLKHTRKLSGECWNQDNMKLTSVRQKQA